MYSCTTRLSSRVRIIMLKLQLKPINGTPGRETKSKNYRDLDNECISFILIRVKEKKKKEKIKQHLEIEIRK